MVEVCTCQSVDVTVEEVPSLVLGVVHVDGDGKMIGKQLGRHLIFPSRNDNEA